MAKPSADSLSSVTESAQALESIERQQETKSLAPAFDVPASSGHVKSSTPAARPLPHRLSLKPLSTRYKPLAAVMCLGLVLAVVIGTRSAINRKRNPPASAASLPVKQAPVPPPSVSIAATPEFAAAEKTEEPTPSPTPSEERFAPIVELTPIIKSITNKTERRASTGEHEAPDPVVVNNQATPDDTATPTATAAKVAGVETSKPKAQPTGKQSVEVVLQIEDGRVVQATVLNHRPELAPYEAAALRRARQRRYPEATKRKETIVVEVNQPD